MISRLKLHNSRIYNSQDGFTLVELIVTSVIICIIGLLINSIFGGFFTSTLDNQSRMALQREMDRAMNQIVRVLREGTDATLIGGGEGITIDTSGGSVDFEYDPGATSPVPLEKDGTNIIRNHMNAGIGVDNLNFVRDATGIKVKVTTTLSLKYVDTVGMDQVITFRNTTILRNSSL